MSRAVVVAMLNSYRRAGDLEGLLRTLARTRDHGVVLPVEAYNVALTACAERHRTDAFDTLAAEIPAGRHDLATCNLLMTHEIRRCGQTPARQYACSCRRH